MIISNSFDIPLPPDEAWPLLMDVPRIAPCLPGAELLETLPDTAYRGRVSLRLGPVALAFNGTARFEEIDNVGHTARLKALGADTKGRGSAASTVTFSLEPVSTGTTVRVCTDLTLTRAVAQYGRGAGMLQDVAQQLIGQFAKALQVMLETQQPTESASPTNEAAHGTVRPGPPTYAAKPIGGLSLIGRLLWNSSVRRFSRK